MLGAFDLVADHQPVAQMHLFMRAKPVRREDRALRVAVDRVGPAAGIKAGQVFGVDVFQRANRQPLPRSNLICS